MATLIDANMLVRYLVGDSPELAQQATDLLQQVEAAQTEVLILDCVVMECYFVLTRFYELPKAEVIDDLKTLLAFDGVINDDKFQIIEALNLVLYKNIDCVDALLCVKSKLYQLELFSFDKRLKKRCTDDTSV